MTTNSPTLSIRRVLVHLATAYGFALFAAAFTFLLVEKFTGDKFLAQPLSRVAQLVPFAIMLLNLFGHARAVPWMTMWQRPAVAPLSRIPAWQVLPLTIMLFLAIRYGVDALSILWAYYKSIWSGLSLPIWVPNTNENALILLDTLIAAPVCEELIYRGVVLNLLLLLMRPHFAVALSATLFTISHQSGWLFPFVMGVCLGYTYLLTGKLWVVITVHAVVNLASRLPLDLWPQPIASVEQSGASGIALTALCVVALVAYLTWCVSWFSRNPVDSAFRAGSGP